MGSGSACRRSSPLSPAAGGTHPRQGGTGMLSVCVSVPHYSEPHRAIALARPLGAECERALSGWGEKQPPRQRLHRALDRSEEHTSELQSRQYLVCRLLLEKKKN